MGAWGPGTFENDDATDWLCELEKTSSLSLIESTLDLAEQEYLETPDGSIVVAATAVVLALSGRSQSGLPDQAMEWVSNQSALDPSALLCKAADGLRKVASSRSELNELWQQSDRYTQWRAKVSKMSAQLPPPGQECKRARYPSLVRRYFAVVIDVLVVIAMVILTVKLLKALGVREGAVWLVLFAPALLYEPILTSKLATIGQMLFRFRIRTAGAQRKISLTQAYSRWVVKLLLGAISMLTIPADRQRRAIHDSMLGTIALDWSKGVPRS